MEYYSTVKRMKSCHCDKLLDLLGIILSEISHSEKDSVVLDLP